MRQALFLDRDGVLNDVVWRGGKPHSPRLWEEVKFRPEMSALSRVSDLGYLLVMATNQPDLSRGLITSEFLDRVHDYCRETFHLDAVYVCPHSSNDHPSKKPNPGMFFAAAKDLAIDLSSSFHLGDTEKDLDAARSAGCGFILWDASYNQMLQPDHRVKNFNELYKLLQRFSLKV